MGHTLGLISNSIQQNFLKAHRENPEKEPEAFARDAFATTGAQLAQSLSFQTNEPAKAAFRNTIKPTRTVNEAVAGRSMDIAQYRQQINAQNSKKEKQQQQQKRKEAREEAKQQEESDLLDWMSVEGKRDSRFHRNRLQKSTHDVLSTPEDPFTAVAIAESLEASTTFNVEAATVSFGKNSSTDVESTRLFGSEETDQAFARQLYYDDQRLNSCTGSSLFGQSAPPAVGMPLDDESPRTTRVERLKRRLLTRSAEEDDDASVCDSVFDALTDTNNPRHGIVTETARQSVAMELSTQEAEDLCIKREKRKRKRAS